MYGDVTTFSQFFLKEHPFKFIQQLFWPHLSHNKKDQVQNSEWQAVRVDTSVEQCAPVSVLGFVFVFVFHFCHISARNVCETETIHRIYSVNIFIRSSQIELVLFHSWCKKRYPHLLEILFREPVKNYGFCPLRGYTPPTPLTDNHFAKKPLAERGVHPPP